MNESAAMASPNSAAGDKIYMEFFADLALDTTSMKPHL